MIWRDAVLEALRRYAQRHGTRLMTRQSIIDEELERIVAATGSIGETPTQTMSRVLQELRDEGLLYFTEQGTYLLADQAFDIEDEDLPDDALEYAIKANRLRLEMVEVGSELATSRRRKGQAKIRGLTLANYRYQCAFCDVTDSKLLVAAHIARWADEPSARGNLHNVICQCCFHDALFEHGYLALTDDFAILKRSGKSQLANLILDETRHFRLPDAYLPAPAFLKKHRERVGW